MQIQDNVFIITGGASGLGAATARMLTEAGGKVVLADVQVEAGTALAKELGGQFIKCDVTSEADGKAVVDAAVAMGTLRGLINCAGTVGHSASSNTGGDQHTCPLRAMWRRWLRNKSCTNNPASPPATWVIEEGCCLEPGVLVASQTEHPSSRPAP